MIDFAVQRQNMVDSQLRPSDITDRRILRIMAELEREAFVPARLQGMSYIDRDLVVSAARGSERNLLAPCSLARLVQLASIEPTDRVLEIGATTGYGTAVIAALAKEVFALEADADLARSAAAALSARRIGNARVVTGALAGGYPEEAPYDAIILMGAVSVVEPALLDQLRDGGRMVGVLAGEGLGVATVWHRGGVHFDARPAFDLAVPALPGFSRRASFVL